MSQTAAMPPQQDASPASARPLLAVSGGVDIAAAERALPGFDLRALSAIAPGDASGALLCLVAPQDEGSIAAALAAVGLARLGTLDWPGGGPDPGLAADLAVALAGRLQAALADAGAARRSAAILRREDEALNRRFKALEDFAWTLGGPRASLALSWAPGTGVARPSAGAREVRQRLPVDISALAAVALLLPDFDADAPIEVAIADSEGRRHPLQPVAGPFGQANGWVRFAAETPLPVDPQDGSLIVTAPPEATVFGLGLPVPDPDFVVQGLAEAQDSTLALKVWRGVAGTAGEMTPLPAAPAQGQHHLRLMPSDLPAPELLARPKQAGDYVKAEFWARENALLVHPSSRGSVCAVIRRVPLPALRRLTAVVNSAHRGAATLGFALGFVPHGQATAENWQEAIGEWLFLPPNGWGEVHAKPRVADAPAQHWDLLAASCVAADAPNDNAWALFRALRASMDATE